MPGSWGGGRASDDDVFRGAAAGAGAGSNLGKRALGGAAGRPEYPSPRLQTARERGSHEFISCKSGLFHASSTLHMYGIFLGHMCTDPCPALPRALQEALFVVSHNAGKLNEFSQALHHADGHHESYAGAGPDHQWRSPAGPGHGGQAGNE